MNRFKSIMNSLQGKSKTGLHWLYNTNANNEDEPEKIFHYGKLDFWFSGTNFRNSEKMILYVAISNFYFGNTDWVNSIPIENYLLYTISPVIRRLSDEYKNDCKNAREKAQFSSQDMDECMEKKSGCFFDKAENRFVLRIHFNVPLVNALSVNAKATVRAVKEILTQIETACNTINDGELLSWIRTYDNQQRIREYLRKNNLCAFIADGSILPRKSGTNKPMEQATPFQTPKELMVTIPLSDGKLLKGMGIPKGITVITGGGYSGKSTLLDAIEQGIYNHIPGDGREYVLTDMSALKVEAEDGRAVGNVNLTPFFRNLSGTNSLDNFCTAHASGSVSQAVNMIEAVCGGVKLFMIDEDKSATNFMIRDKNMRKIVPNEPIIPFTDRIEELYEECKVSTILVIGGSSEYLAYAHTVILMDNYLPQVITGKVRELMIEKRSEQQKATWMRSRYLIPKNKNQPFLYFRSVVTENEKKIILDEYSSDITHLTSLITGEQLNTLMCIMEAVLTDQETDQQELMEIIISYTESILGDREQSNQFNASETTQRFYSKIRPIDAWCCINRMRGVLFTQ